MVPAAITMEHLRKVHELEVEIVNHYRPVVAFLLNGGTNVNAFNQHGFTPLHICARYGGGWKLSCFSILLGMNQCS